MEHLAIILIAATGVGFCCWWLHRSNKRPLIDPKRLLEQAQHDLLIYEAEREAADVALVTACAKVTQQHSRIKRLKEWTP